MKMMIRPGALSGTIRAISSKSHAHRLLVLAALCDAPVRVRMDAPGEDVAATLSCLTRLGAQVSKAHDGVTVHPIKTPAAHPLLECGESGTTLRLLLPVAAALCPSVKFHGKGRLPERPIAELQEAIAAHGVAADRPALPFTTKGQLKGGVFSLPGNISSQYVSGLLLALPLVGGGEIRITGPLVSAGYVDMTIAAMAQFGVGVVRREDGFLVPGGKRYRSPGTVQVEGDWSSAAFFLTAGALSGPVTVMGLSLGSLQRDKQIVELLLRFGADVTVLPDGVRVSAGEGGRGAEIDLEDVPDLAPILAVAAAATGGGETVFRRVSRLRDKESDRVAAILHLMQGFGVRAFTGPDEIIIRGGGLETGGPVDGFSDHRIVMAAAILATAAQAGETLISGAQAVNKSYPGFFEDFVRLGGSAHVI